MNARRMQQRKKSEVNALLERWGMIKVPANGIRDYQHRGANGKGGGWGREMGKKKETQPKQKPMLELSQRIMQEQEQLFFLFTNFPSISFSSQPFASE